MRSSRKGVTLLGMFGISFPELVVVAIVGLIAFGPDKLPELARTLGQLSAQLRKASDSLRRDFYRELYPPLPDNPISQAKRDLQLVTSDIKATFTGAAYEDDLRRTHCQDKGLNPAPQTDGAVPPASSGEPPKANEKIGI